MTTPPLTPEAKRWQQISTLWKDNRWLYVVVGILLGLLITPAAEQIAGDLNTLIGNVVPEALGIIFTVLILDRLAENRTQEDLKHRLLEQVRSPSAGTAVTALNWLRRENWITDDTFKRQSILNLNWEGAYVGDLNLEGCTLRRANFKNTTNTLLSVDGDEKEFPLNLSSAELWEANLSDAIIPYAVLKQADLRSANLQQADLEYANLKEANLGDANLNAANLWFANLYQADLRDANLQAVKLAYANLQGADLRDANLQAAKLGYANLQNADLRKANLQDTDLREANLCGVNLENAFFSEKTVLPDAKPLTDTDGNALRQNDGNDLYTQESYWTPDTDMTRFTDPNHPDFWQPDYLRTDFKGIIPRWLREQRKQQTNVLQ